MCHKKARFGHRVWCSIIVVRPRQEAGEEAESSLQEVQLQQQQQPEVVVVCEAPTPLLLPHINTQPQVPPGEEEEEEAATRDQEEDDELMVEDMMAHTSAAPSKEPKSAAEVDLLSAQDILSFEMLDIRDRNTPKVSQTATPTNTPMGT